MNNTKDAIDKFCSIILTEKDYIEKELADEYINNLGNEIAELNKIEQPEKNFEIRSWILNNVLKYLSVYQTQSSSGIPLLPPFSFDSGNNYSNYRLYFEEKYKAKYQYAKMPAVFCFAFEYIQDISEHYRIFVAFSDTHDIKIIQDFYNKISEYSQSAVEQTANHIVDRIVKRQVRTVVQQAVEDAKISSHVALEQAKKASLEAEQAANNAVQTAVQNKMSDVTKQVSETSVTILGIFAAIVLTIVAGLFYSASVINNINSADFYKLLTVSSLVGFVCFNLLALMFRYIERIRSNGLTDTKKFSKVTMFVSITLLVIMIVSGILQYRDSEGITNIQEEMNTANMNSSTMQENEEGALLEEDKKAKNIDDDTE